MTEKTDIIRIEKNPRLSKVLVANGFAFLSGLTARDKTGDIKQQTADILEQIDGYLAAASTDRSKLVSVNIWLKDISQFKQMNEVWEAWVDPETVPSRATVQAELAHRDILVEIKAQALV
jgi:enamine deaminase RidA (YjgF/YER057c/UK114 family)